MSRNEDFFERIGHISVLFATLDFYVSNLLVLLHPSQEVAFRETDTLGRKLAMLESLSDADVTSVEVLRSLQAVLPQTKAIVGERNRYIHDLWEFSPELIAVGSIRRHRVRFTPSLETDRTVLTLENLSAFSEVVSQAQEPFERALASMRPGFLNIVR